MSTEEKEIENKNPVTGARVAGWWKKAKVFILIYDTLKIAIIVIGVVWGVGIALENRVAEILSVPKRTSALFKQDSAKFQFVDSSLVKHNGYFTSVFKYVDTTKRKR